VNRLFALLGIYVLVTLALPLSSQEGSSAVPRAVYGRLDPRTGIFTPLRQLPAVNPEADAEEPPPTTTYTGKFVLNFTITITSAIPTGTVIACDGNATLVDSTGDESDSLSNSAVRSGSTATCSVTIPYSWAVTSTSESVYVTYDISAPPQPLSSSATFPRRYSSHPLAKITVPANGATTTYTISATI